MGEARVGGGDLGGGEGADGAGAGEAPGAAEARLAFVMGAEAAGAVVSVREGLERGDGLLDVGYGEFFAGVDCSEGCGVLSKGFVVPVVAYIGATVVVHPRGLRRC